MEIGNNHNVLSKIRSGDRTYLRDIYEKQRPEFMLWISKYYQCDDETAAEVYQQAFITMFYNIKDGKLTELKSSLKTYLFAIGKNLLRDQFKITQRRQEILEVAIESQELDTEIIDRYEQSDKKEVVKQLMAKIGEPCRTVLELFYFKNYAMDAIAAQMDYKTEQIAAKRKFICLKQMRNLMLDTQQEGAY